MGAVLDVLVISHRVQDRLRTYRPLQVPDFQASRLKVWECEGEEERWESYVGILF